MRTRDLGRCCWVFSVVTLVFGCLPYLGSWEFVLMELSDVGGVDEVCSPTEKSSPLSIESRVDAVAVSSASELSSGGQCSGTFRCFQVATSG